MATLMRCFVALLLLCTTCSDYDLRDKNDDPGRPAKGDSAGPDTAVAEDSAPPVDSGHAEETAGTTEHPDGKIDVVLLVDVAYFYDCYHADLPLNTERLTDALLGTGADVAIAIATFDDYQVSGEWWAADDGNPYLLLQQLTTSEAKLDAAAATLSLDWGGDGPGTGFEAIYQATRGLGYDQDCDSSYDKGVDVKPYTADSGDAFGGKEAGVADSSVPGTGDGAGVGFRKDSKRVVAVFGENGFRDTAYGHEVPKGTCPGVATSAEAEKGLDVSGAKFLGINAYEFQDIDHTPQEQMELIATNSKSYIDRDGDGAEDDLAVLAGSWDWPKTDVLVAAIWDLVD